jgi:hypothetical protein
VIKPMQDGELEKWHEAAPDMLQQWVDAMAEAGQGEQAEEVAEFWRAQTAD